MALKKEIQISLFASASEAYNACIYYFLAPFLSPILFPGTPPLQALLFSYSIAMIAPLIAYPLGAFYYGIKGDKKGRIEACTSSSIGLAIATGCMGLIPTTPLFQPYAWVFFSLLICCNHFFSGGEYYSCVIFSLEHGEKKQQGFLSGLICLASVSGLLLANLAGLFASEITHTHAWRWAFGFGFLSGIVSYLLKYYCQESPVFEKALLKNKIHTRLNPYVFFKNNTASILKTAVLPAYFGSLYAFIFYFLAQHSPNLNTPTSIISITAFYGICLVIFGYLSEKYSQKILMTTGSIANVLTMITLLNHRNSEALIIPIYALIFFSSMIIGPLHAWMIQQFPPEKRCRGLIFSVGLGSAIAYGTTTPLALYFYKQGHNFLIAGLYPLVLSLLTVWVVCNRPFSADTKTTPIYENI